MKVFAMLGVLTLISPHSIAPALQQGGGSSGHVIIPCNYNKTKQVDAPLAWVGESTVGYIEAGSAALAIGVANVFSCDKVCGEGDWGGCNLSPRFTVEDAQGNPVNVSAPFDVTYWTFGTSVSGAYTMTLTIPAGFILTASCTRCVQQ
jgi:hypothetical protein